MKKSMKKTKKQPVSKYRKKFTCMRCKHSFATKRMLKIHSKKHTEALNEIELLKHGHIPSYTKIGTEFKGRNKIVIS